jgi:hypothetical protein
MMKELVAKAGEEAIIEEEVEEEDRYSIEPWWNASSVINLDISNMNVQP